MVPRWEQKWEPRWYVSAYIINVIKSLGSQNITKIVQIFVKFIDNEDTVDIIQEGSNQLSDESRGCLERQKEI